MKERIADWPFFYCYIFGLEFQNFILVGELSESGLESLLNIVLIDFDFVEVEDSVFLFGDFGPQILDFILLDV